MICHLALSGIPQQQQILLWQLLWILGAMLTGIGVPVLLQHCSKVVLTNISSAVPAGH
jgi:hypothetical protein